MLTGRDFCERRRWCADSGDWHRPRRCVGLGINHSTNAIAADLVCIGEMGLSGEVRSVPQLELRLQEAEKLGFKTAVIPAVDRDKLSLTFSTLKLKWVSTLQAALGESGLA